MSAKPADVKVLHFNDCANVGWFLVRSAARAGLHWDYLSPSQVRPARDPGRGWGRIKWLPYLANRAAHVSRAEVVHVHYATSVPLLWQRPVPRRPYFLHLHGSDIRRRWKEPDSHDLVQRAIDGAEKVFFTNLDTIAEALEARADAEYMPAFVEPALLPQWQAGAPGTPPSGQTIVFASRWDEDKGAEKQLELVAALRRAFPKVTLEGLDWGPAAAAARELGVKLRPKMSHPNFLNWLAGADLAVGQANRILAISEFEAMAIGLPVAALGSRIPRLDDGSTPPVLEGSVPEVMEAVSEALKDPRAVSQALHGRDWVLAHHQADSYIPSLAEAYRQAAG